MQENDFWNLIERSKKNSTSPDEQAEVLTELLTRLQAKDITDFDRIFYQLMRDSYRADLWGAAYLVNGGCSDDGFEYFRAWLIGQGKDVYEAALANPESLADVVDKDVYEVENEDLMYAARNAYTEKTGRQPEVPPMGGYPELTLDWNEDNVGEKFPRLAEKFGG